MERRTFLKSAAGTGLLLGTRLPELCGEMALFGAASGLSRVEARYYRKLPDREIECLLCPRLCRLGDKERGFCGVRENDGGVYRTLVYGKACSVNIDPVEKKPFFHFLPGTTSLSMATAGCNANCKFCQNWEISQVRPEQVENFDFPPELAAAQAEKNRCRTIAYTYTEPVVFFEYMYDTAVKAREKGVRSIVVTGGNVNREPLLDLLEVVDAVKVDLKAFDESFYTNYVRARLGPVLETIKTIAKSGTWLEIVYLVIPTLNDKPAAIRDMARWIRNEAGDRIPVHFSRFQPMYLLKNLPPTPVTALDTARSIALEEGLKYVYVGNVPGHQAESTYCPTCGRRIIGRFGYKIETMDIVGGKCRHCGQPIPGVWS